MLTPSLWQSFLAHVGPRRMRLITAQALLTMACGRQADMAVYGESVHKYLRKHWDAYLERPQPSVWQARRPAALLTALGLEGRAEQTRVLLRLLKLAHQHELESQHLAALVYGLAETGVTRSELHQRPWTARRHHRGQVTATYMQALVEKHLMVASQRPHRGTPITVWHTTARGRDLILATWARPVPAALKSTGYVNRNAA